MLLRRGVTGKKLFTLLKIKSFLSSLKNFCIKYWRALIAFSLVVVGILIGRRTNSDKEIKLKMEKLDAEAAARNAKEKMDSVLDIKERHIEEVESAIVEKQKKIKAVEKQKLKNIDEMSNNSENLDRILKEKYNLNKGE